MIHGNERIRELAALYQSPGAIGRHMAQLASTGKVHRADIQWDIDRTRSEFDPFNHQVHSELNELWKWSQEANDDGEEEEPWNTMLRI